MEGIWPLLYVNGTVQETDAVPFMRHIYGEMNVNVRRMSVEVYLSKSRHMVSHNVLVGHLSARDDHPCPRLGDKATLNA